MDLEIFNNGGNSLDLSLKVLERAMLHSDNVYEIPNVKINGKVCFTNLPSNTAFRGFGGPQGMLIAENWIQRISMELNRSPEEIRVFIIFSMKISFFVISFVIYTYSLLYACMYCFQEINFQKEGSILHYGQQIEHSTLDRLWNELKASCKFLEAREKVEQFNAHNRWKKRGISIIPTKFGISFTVKFMNQVVFVFLYLNLASDCQFNLSICYWFSTRQVHLFKCTQMEPY